MHTDTLEHYYIFTALMTYQAGHDADRAYNMLQRRGIDLQNTARFTPSVQKIMAEIDALAHENSRAKEAFAEAEATKYEEQAEEEPDEDQE